MSKSKGGGKMYKVTNKLGAHVKFKGKLFRPYESKLLKEAPTSDKFNVEQIEEQEKKEKTERRDKQ